MKTQRFAVLFSVEKGITFVQVYQDFKGFQGKTTVEFFSWLKTIAEAKLIDAIRAANRKKRGGEFEQITDPPSDFSRSYLNLLEQLDGVIVENSAIEGKLLDFILRTLDLP